MLYIYYLSQEARAEIFPPVEAQVSHRRPLRAAEPSKHDLEVARAGSVDDLPTPALMLQNGAPWALAHTHPTIIYIIYIMHAETWLCNYYIIFVRTFIVLYIYILFAI